MRGIWSGKAVKVMSVALCFGLLVASAEARLQTIRLSLPGVLPGVDPWGNLEHCNYGDASVKATLNTREQRVYAQLHGYVPNASGRSFYAEDIFVGTNLFGYTVISDIYRVSSRGSAYLVSRAYLLER